MSDVDLETEFEKINLEESPCKSRDCSRCDCKKSIVKQLEHSTNTGSSLKVKERRKNLIKPARLKHIGTCWSRKVRHSSFQQEASNAERPATVTADDLDAFASDAFVKMRITPEESMNLASPIEEKSSQSSQPNSCSAQAKLQQQFPSSEFDSAIDEMSEFLGYHLNLNLYPQEKNYLVNSMYT